MLRLQNLQVVNGQDIMCKSRTGSGKTLAFAIPIIEALDRQVNGRHMTERRNSEFPMAAKRTRRQQTLLSRTQFRGVLEYSDGA